jgi:hypothetical protein
MSQPAALPGLGSFFAEEPPVRREIPTMTMITRTKTKRTKATPDEPAIVREPDED